MDIEEKKENLNIEKNKKDKVKKELIEWVFCFVIAYIIYLFVNYFIGSISGVKQTSMNPTAVEGDKIILQRTVVFKRDINRGDIVTFVSPTSLPNTTEPTTYTLSKDAAKASYEDMNVFETIMYDFFSIGKASYIKRVIGIGGDHVYIDKSGDVYVNDVKLEEPYLNDGTTDLNGRYVDVIVPEGYLYVMGDNRLHSMDSRCFGCIPIEKIDGYVLTRVWPFNKLGAL